MNGGPTRPEDRVIQQREPTRADPEHVPSHEDVCGAPSEACTCSRTHWMKQAARFQGAFLEVSRYEQGMRTALENLLVGLDFRIAFHEAAGRNEVRDESAIAADAIRGILGNPTAALDG